MGKMCNCVDLIEEIDLVIIVSLTQLWARYIVY